MLFIEVFSLFLLIFESLGTAELGLIAIVALILLGPRKLPFYARKIGKTINEFKRTTNDFKQTWEKEAGLNDIENDLVKPVSRHNLNDSTINLNGTNLAEVENKFANQNLLPTVKEVDTALVADSTPPTVEQLDERSKRSWL